MGITSLYGSNGYIGIGTANPRTHLDLNGTMIVNTTSTNAMLRFTNDSGINYIQSGSILADGSSAPLYFTSIYGQNKWMTIAANGNVGIGKTNPVYTLDVNGTISATGTIFATNPTALWMPSNGAASLYITDSQSSPANGTTTYGRYFGLSGVIYQDFFNLFQWRGCGVTGGVTNANAMSLSSGGNLTVNTASTIYTVVNNGIYFTGDIEPAQWRIVLGGEFKLFFDMNTSATGGPSGPAGTYVNKAYINNSGTFVTTSDMRLKNTIEPIISGLSSILQLKPSTFFYNNNTQQHAGFIAQDVLPILPLAIETNKRSENDDTKYYYLNQSMIIPYTVKAIQEQQQIIQQQSSEINELKAQLTAITQRLAAANIA
jgi:hypothetical protein